MFVPLASSFLKPKPPPPRSCLRPSAMSTLSDLSPSNCRGQRSRQTVDTKVAADRAPSKSTASHQLQSLSCLFMEFFIFVTFCVFDISDFIMVLNGFTLFKDSISNMTYKHSLQPSGILRLHSETEVISCLLLSQRKPEPDPRIRNQSENFLSGRRMKTCGSDTHSAIIRQSFF